MVQRKVLPSNTNEYPSVARNVNVLGMREQNPKLFVCGFLNQDGTECAFSSPPQAFRTNCDLARHELRHVPKADRPHKCTQCGQTFVQATGLTNHMNVKHTEDAKSRNRCLCGYETADPAPMYRHLDKEASPSGRVAHQWVKYEGREGSRPGLQKNLRGRKPNRVPRLARSKACTNGMSAQRPSPQPTATPMALDGELDLDLDPVRQFNQIAPFPEPTFPWSNSSGPLMSDVNGSQHLITHFPGQPQESPLSLETTNTAFLSFPTQGSGTQGNASMIDFDFGLTDHNGPQYQQSGSPELFWPAGINSPTFVPVMEANPTFPDFTAPNDGSQDKIDNPYGIAAPELLEGFAYDNLNWPQFPVDNPDLAFPTENNASMADLVGDLSMGNSELFGQNLFGDFSRN